MSATDSTLPKQESCPVHRREYHPVRLEVSRQDSSLQLCRSHRGKPPLPPQEHRRKGLAVVPGMGSGLSGRLPVLHAGGVRGTFSATELGQSCSERRHPNPRVTIASECHETFSDRLVRRNHIQIVVTDPFAQKLSRE